jgi:hypothetical protein
MQCHGHALPSQVLYPGSQAPGSELDTLAEQETMFWLLQNNRIIYDKLFIEVT